MCEQIQRLFMACGVGTVNIESNGCFTEAYRDCSSAKNVVTAETQ